MSREIINSELLKENPDWLLISNIAKDLHNQSGENPLNFKKGSINFIKTSEFNPDFFFKELSGTFNSDEYNIIGHDNTTKFNKWINSNPDLNSKYHIVLTSKTNMIVNASTKGYNTIIYKGTVYNRWNKKDTKFTIKGNDIDVSFLEGQLRQELRNITLTNLLG